MTVVPFEPRRSSSDSFVTPADAMPFRPAALEMGCHLPEVYSDDRPGVSLGVQVWAFGSIFAAVVIGAFYFLAQL